MLRIGICDDIYDARLVLRSALERVLEARKVQGQFYEFSSGEGLLRWLEGHAGELDIVFLDMEMGELDGMETARRLRAADDGLQLVFVTGYADHVFDGYSVGALGYLLKPPKPEQLEAVVDRAQAAIQALTQDQYLQWKQLGEEIQGKLEQAVRSGRSPQGAEGEAITALHRRWLTFTGQTYAGDKHRGLAALYTQDPRFTAYYDRAVPGCAAFLQAAVEHWA